MEVDRLSVRYVHPRLGRILFFAAVGVFCGALLISTTALFLLSPSPLPSAVGAALGWSLLAAPILTALGAIVSSWSIPPAALATLEAGEGGLRITNNKGSKWIPRDQIESGLVIPSSERPVLELSLKSGRTIVVAVTQEQEAHALLSALGVDASRRRVAVPLGGPNRQLKVGCLSFPIAFIVVLFVVVATPLQERTGLLVFAASFTMTMLLILRASRPTEVVVGTDGLSIRGAFRRRFIPYSAIEEAELSLSSALTLKLRSGEHVAIRAEDFRSRRALCDRIHEAMRANDSLSTDGLADLELLEPRGLTLSAWREALRALVNRRGAYRRASISDDALLSVVTDPEAAPGMRVGAALALRMSGHEEAGAKIRVAAEACANEGMRAALSGAAEDELDEATLERALEEAAEAEATAGARRRSPS